MLHYGLLFHVDKKSGGKWSWDKHRYHSFNISKCPPWDFSVHTPQEGIFWPPPPTLEELPERVRGGRGGRSTRVCGGCVGCVCRWLAGFTCHLTHLEEGCQGG